MFALISRRKRIRASALGVARQPAKTADITDTTDLHRQRRQRRQRRPRPARRCTQNGFKSFRICADFWTKTAPNPANGLRLLLLTGLTPITPDDPQKSICLQLPNPRAGAANPSSAAVDMFICLFSFVLRISGN